MEYCEAMPSAVNAAFIKKYWSIKGTPDLIDAAPEPILPDGCVEIIFDLADRFVQYHEDGRVELQARTIIAGQMSRGILIGPTGETDLFGVRFQPAGAFPLFGTPLYELTDIIIDASLLFGSDESFLFEQLSEKTNITERTNIFDTHFRSKAAASKMSAGDAEVAADLIVKSRGTLAVGNIASKLGLSERRLERTFRDRIGISPKLFSRIERFQTFLRNVDAEPNRGLLDLALDAGYYDQSHMIRDFRAFTGSSPTAFLGRENVISDLFVSGE